MTPVVRPLRPADLPAVVEVLAAAAPYQMITEEWLGWHLTGAPAAERFGVLVAGTADGVVGAALTGLLHESAEPGWASSTSRCTRSGAAGAPAAPC
ncbi:hypothetical protein ABZ807_11940 [Micromonospora sp. NPDC047548]|uniref:hypothetical protein n=1 Tax=Micromonospora sp. NPDC047548 TaxID=3155624 RepID=UPI0034049F64